jgi:hypothetical protein
MHALAGMGSGLTFTMLAFIIHLSVCTQVCSTLRLPYKEVASRVYVYGDDLIVPSEWFELAVTGLNRSGLQVNGDKSFVKGPFRESCGGDYLLGKDCAPTRLRLQNANLPLKSGKDSLFIDFQSCDKNNLIVSLESHARELVNAGMQETAECIYKVLSDYIPLPLVGAGSPVLGRLTVSTADIARQGTVGPDGSTYTVKAVVKRAASMVSRQVCPYKYLGSFLKSSWDTVQSLLGNSEAKVFGEVAIPRKQHLLIRKISVVSALPVAERQPELPEWLLRLLLNREDWLPLVL